MNTNVAKILKSTAPEVQTDALDIVAQFCSASLLAPLSASQPSALTSVAEFPKCVPMLRTTGSPVSFPKPTPCKSPQTDAGRGLGGFNR
jgi:hypothetical protein